MTNTETQPQAEIRSTRGRVPIMNPLLNGEDFDIDIQEASFTFSNGEHDTATISATSTTLEDTEGMLDSAISFYWGVAPNIETFNGYIANVEETHQATGALSFNLHLLGATKMMFEGRPRFWSDKTIPDAVRDLAHRNRLGYSGDSHTHVWRALAQTNESDWRMANELATRIGWVVFNRNGVVLCVDPLKMYTDNGSYVRLQAGSDIDVVTDRMLIDFQPTETADVIEQNLGTRYGYFSSDNKVQIGTQPGEFKGYVFDSRAVIRDQSESLAYIDSLDSITGDWKQHAGARIWGDADIYPGMNVVISTTNTRILRDKYDGKWLVKATAHQLDRQQYQTLLYLCRPASDMTLRDLPYVPFWSGGSSDGRAKPYLTLNEGRWVSSWTSPTVRALT